MPKWLLLACLLATGIGLCAAAPADIAPPLSVTWTFSMGADPMNIARPILHDSRLYVSHAGVLYCLDTITGAEQWKFQPEDAFVSTSPIIYDNVIIVGATNATAYGFDAKTGKQLWDRICASSVAPTPQLYGEQLILAAGEIVYSLSPTSGDATWICSLTSAARMGPVIDDSMAYFLCHDGSLQCVNASQGRYRWSVDLRTGPRTFPPVAAGGRAIVASGDLVYGVSRSGAVGWTAQMPAGIGGAPTVADGVLYVPCVDGRLYLLSAASGAPRRRPVYQVESSLTAPPAVSEAYVVTGTADALIYALDASTGEVAWTYRCRGPNRLPNEAALFGIYSPLMIHEGSLYCLTGDGDLYRFSRAASDLGGPVFGDLTPLPGSALPGGAFYGPQCSIVDDASGVNPKSVQAFVDGTPIPATFDPVTGTLALRADPYSDGSHVVKVVAADNRGNEATAEWSFVTDASIMVSAEQRQPAAGGGRMGGGGGMRGGGGGGGGMRGGGGRGGGGRGGRGGGRGDF